MIIEHVSATQYKTWKECKRKWYYEKVLRLPKKPPGAGIIKGLKHHKEIENFLKTGVDARTGVAQSAKAVLSKYLVHAPYNGGKMGVELNIEGTLATPGGIRFKGGIDVFLPRVCTGVAGIIDHKFKGTIDDPRFPDSHVTPVSLRSDIQCIIYSAYIFTRDPEAEEASFAHHQYQTKQAQFSEEVAVKPRMSRDEVLSKFNALCSDIDSNMTQVAKAKDARDVEANTCSCSKWGGCDFANVCPSYSAWGLLTQSVSNTNAEKNMSLLDDMISSAPAPTPELKPAPISTQPTLTTASAPVDIAVPAPLPSILPPDAPIAAAKKPKTKKLEVVDLSTTTPIPSGGKVLYIDCAPSTGYTDLNPLVYTVAQELAKAADVSDLRQGKTEALGFGGWKPTLANAVLDRIRALDGPAFINSNGINEAVVDVLRAVYPVVVRPMR